MTVSYDPLFDDGGLGDSLEEERESVEGGVLSLKDRLEEMVGSLNEVQRSAVCEKEGAILVLAGAGSGKTKVLTTRLALLIGDGMWASRILAVTFTNKAAGEMRKRVGEMVGAEEASRIWMGTFHALSLRILRVHGEKLGFSRDFTILSQDDSLRLIKTIMKGLNIDVKQVSPKSVLWRIEGWKNRGLGYEEALEEYQRGGFSDSPGKKSKGDLSDDLALSLYETYQRQLLESDAMDFGDLLLYCLRLFREHEDVLDFYAEKFRSVSVDEYQDSNPAQRAWILALSTYHGNLFCVGDEDQSIYGWRGATIDNILKFRQDFAEAKVLRLEQNYRSTGIILRAASELIRLNRERYEKTLWTEGDDGEFLDVVACTDGREEAMMVAQAIEREDEGVTQAILVRAGHQTRSFEEALTRLNIPYRVVGNVKFYERSEIRDLVAYLRLVAKPYDRMAFERIVNTPSRGIGPATLQKVQDVADSRQEKFMETLEAIHETPSSEVLSEDSSDFFRRAEESEKPVESVKSLVKPSVVDFMGQVRKWRADRDKVSPPELLEIIVRESGYREMVRNENDPLTGETRLENIQALKEVLHDFVSLDSFLDHISLVLDNEEASDSKREKVSIMTMHSAKGLEFDTVYLPCWEMDSFPNRRAVLEESERGLEEERRLAYVALTRARKRVCVSYARERFSHGTLDRVMPSPFISELPKDVCRFSGEALSSGSQGLRNESRRTSSSASESFSEGSRCAHKRYGEGVVESVSRDVVTVMFDNPDVGKKIIIARFLSCL